MPIEPSALRAAPPPAAVPPAGVAWNGASRAGCTSFLARPAGGGGGGAETVAHRACMRPACAALAAPLPGQPPQRPRSARIGRASGREPAERQYHTLQRAHAACPSLPWTVDALLGAPAAPASTCNAKWPSAAHAAALQNKRAECWPSAPTPAFTLLRSGSKSQPPIVRAPQGSQRAGRKSPTVGCFVQERCPPDPNGQGAPAACQGLADAGCDWAGVDICYYFLARLAPCPAPRRPPCPPTIGAWREERRHGGLGGWRGRGGPETGRPAPPAGRPAQPPFERCRPVGSMQGCMALAACKDAWRAANPTACHCR